MHFNDSTFKRGIARRLKTQSEDTRRGLHADPLTLRTHATCSDEKVGRWRLTCLRPTCLPMCLRDDACLRPARPSLSSGSAFARPCVFATTRAFARPIFGRCLLTRTWRHSRKCVRAVWSGSVFRRPRVFAPRSVFATRSAFAGHVSSDTHLSWLSSPSICLLTPMEGPRCLGRLCFATSVLDPMCLQNVSPVFGRYVHPPSDRNAIPTCWLQHSSCGIDICALERSG